MRAAAGSSPPVAAPGRPWGPPLFSYHYQHDRLSALAALTVSPKRQPRGLYLRFQPRHFQALAVAACLRARLRHRRGPIIGLWDRGSMHRGPTIEAVCQAHPRLHLAEFPAYAPELTPTEQGWNDCKGRMAHSLRRDTWDLRRRLAANTRRVRHSQAKLRAFIQSSKLPLPP
jgi:putative transposase